MGQGAAHKSTRRSAWGHRARRTGAQGAREGSEAAPWAHTEQLLGAWVQPMAQSAGVTLLL